MRGDICDVEEFSSENLFFFLHSSSPLESLTQELFFTGKKFSNFYKENFFFLSQLSPGEREYYRVNPRRRCWWMNDRDIVTIDQQQKLINKTENIKIRKKNFFSLSLFRKAKQEGSRKISNSTLRFQVRNDTKWVSHYRRKNIIWNVCTARGAQEAGERESKREREHESFGIACCILIYVRLCISTFYENERKFSEKRSKTAQLHPSVHVLSQY